MVIDSDTASQGAAAFASTRGTPSLNMYHSSSSSISTRELGRNMNGYSFKPFIELNQSLDPSLTFSERAKILQGAAADALTIYARENPSVQKLVEAHHNWESKLRSETERRMGAFQPEPFLRRSGLLDEDPTMLNLSRSSSRALLKSSGMKKSVSLGTFEGYGSSTHVGADGGRTESQPSALGSGYPRASQDPFVGGSRRFAIHSSQHERRRQGPQPSLGFQGPPSCSSSLSQLEETKLCVNNGPAGRGMIKAHSNMSLEELSTAINAKAQRKLEAFLSQVQTHSQRALLQATSSMKETAANLEGNLQLLSSMLGANWAPVGSAQMGSMGPRSMQWPGSQLRLRAPGDKERGQELGVDQKPMDDWLNHIEQFIQDMGKMQNSRNATRSVRDPGRQVAIVTTAALPWMTGTSINPLLRAAYLSADEQRKVTLVIPWLSKIDQDRVYPNDTRFDTPEEQEVFVREWARKRTGLDCNFKITFYPGRYAIDRGFIMPVGDITTVIPDGEADVAVLEEPEHLTWYHHGKRWSEKFNQVVGVMHTNYLDYIRREPGGDVCAFMLEHFNRYVCGVHCDKVIKLSDAVQPLPRQRTLFVHGVSPSFLKVGAAKAGLLLEDGKSVRMLEGPTPSKSTAEAETGAASPDAESAAPRFSKGAYFLGKALWAKGYTELLELMKEHTSRTGDKRVLNVYGHGPELEEIESDAINSHLAMKFNGARDHADASLHDYKVFINPSLSDVVATTTAEALAMGKFVVCADHPSNRFFEQYDNCLIYRNSEEFSQCLEKALSSEPKPLSLDELHSLSWEAATDRFLEVADITTKMNPLEAAAGTAMYSVMNTLLGMEGFRQAMGAGAQTRDLPDNLRDFQPSQEGTKMLFDMRPSGTVSYK